MSIEHSEVGHRNLRVQVQILDHLECVFHRLPLTDVLSDPDTEPLQLEFKLS